MNTITNLKGTRSTVNFTEPPVHHHNNGEVHTCKTTDGRQGGVYHRFIRSGPSGIICGNGKTAIAITKEELWKLAEQIEPDLAVPQTVTVPIEAGKDKPTLLA